MTIDRWIRDDHRPAADGPVVTALAWLCFLAIVVVCCVPCSIAWLLEREPRR